jgi:hypothetical protein
MSLKKRRGIPRSTKSGAVRKKMTEKGGGSGGLIVFMMFFFSVGLYLAMTNLFKSGTNLSNSARYKAVALQLADSGLDQIMSKVRNREIILPLEVPGGTSPTPTPRILGVPVGVDAFTTTTVARISVVSDSTGVILRDVEGNVRYQVEVVVNDVNAISSKTRYSINRGVKAVFAVVNFGRYMSFTSDSDHKVVDEFSGPYHTNGNVTITGTGSGTDWNNACPNVSGCATPNPTPSNPWWDPSYTTVAAGQVIISGAVSTRSNERVYASGGSFVTYPNSTSSSGTFLDATNGGFAVTLAPIPYQEFSSLAHIVIQKDLVRTSNIYNLQGVPNNSGPVNVPGCAVAPAPQMDVGDSNMLVNDYPIRINLNALNKALDSAGSTGAFGAWQCGDGLLSGGSSSSDAIANYEAALTSEFGLMIYVDGDAAIWGTLPNSTDATINKNKKVTIVVKGNAYLVGDLLPSDSPYALTVQQYDDLVAPPIYPTPTADNPHDDAIAILAGGTGGIIVDPWRRGDVQYFKNNSTAGTGGEMRMTGLLYAPNGFTGGRNQCPPSGFYALSQRCWDTTSPPAGAGYTGFNYFAFHGAVVVKTSGNLPGYTEYKRFYDHRLKYNLSKIIPAAISVSRWQEMTSIPKLTLPTPTPTP